MPRIKILNQKTCNQIAAGEVVVRPCFVLKELIENALDANSCKIEIYVDGGGIKKIAVVDNGDGINELDFPLVLQAHTTSKINKIDDLFNINTFGFRGEALSSIASVSELEFISGEENKTARFINSIDENIIPASRNRGTTVNVNNLFFNIPARRNFLSSEFTEYLHCQRVFFDYALRFTDIHWKFFKNKKLFFNFPACENSNILNLRFKNIIGADFPDKYQEINCKIDEIELDGWMGCPSIARNRTNKQFLFVNNRPIKDKTVLFTLRQGFKDVLYSSRHMCFILNINIPPNRLDINIHPNKSEVRFRDHEIIKSFLIGVFKDLAQGFSPLNESYFSNSIASTTLISKEKQEQITPQDILLPYTENNQDKKNPSNLQENYNPSPETAITPANNYLPFSPQQNIVPQEKLPNINSFESEKIEKHGLGFAIAQIANIYILAQIDNGLIIVDMHAAHERIIYEELKKNYSNKNYSQILLLPEKLSLDVMEVDVLLQINDKLQNMGFEITKATDNIFTIISVPLLLKEQKNHAKIIKDIISDFAGINRSNLLEHMEHQVLAAMACKAAIHAGNKLNIAQMNSLLRKIETTASANFCNHGRPTWKKFSLKDLDKFFLRGQ